MAMNIDSLFKYHSTYGRIPSSSDTTGGLYILNQDLHNGFGYAWPLTCPVPLPTDGTEVMHRLTAHPDEPSWSIGGVHYLGDGSVFIQVWDLVHEYHVNVPEQLKAVIPKTLCLGIEVEFSAFTGPGVSKALDSVSNKAIFKEDSSCGIELVSVPLVPADMVQFISDLEIDQLGVDNSCGVHVHLSRKYISQSQLGGLVVFMNHPTNLQYIEEVAGRATNDYCKHLPGKTSITSTDRYEMVNLINSETVEIRIFAGTNQVNVLIGYVTWLHNLINWLGTTPCSYTHVEFKEYLETL